MFSLTIPELVLGFGLLGAGCFLHVVTKGQLIRNVVLCRSGVYEIVRHPYYLANYAIDSAICLLSGNIYLVAIYPFLFFWAYGPAFREEETHLASQHGDSFYQHTACTPQVFPSGDSVPRWNSLREGYSAKRVTLKEWARVARFWASALFIVSVHETKIEGLHALCDRRDLDAYVLFGLVVVLSVTSSFLLARTKRQSRVAASCSN
jgi:steroid 5-alpha reductase family enzyme